MNETGLPVGSGGGNSCEALHFRMDRTCLRLRSHSRSRPLYLRKALRENLSRTCRLTYKTRQVLENSRRRSCCRFHYVASLLTSLVYWNLVSPSHHCPATRAWMNDACVSVTINCVTSICNLTFFFLENLVESSFRFLNYLILPTNILATIFFSWIVTDQQTEHRRVQRLFQGWLGEDRLAAYGGIEETLPDTLGYVYYRGSDIVQGPLIVFLNGCSARADHTHTPFKYAIDANMLYIESRQLMSFETFPVFTVKQNKNQKNLLCSLNWTCCKKKYQ